MNREALLELLIYSLDNSISKDEKARLDHALKTDKWLALQQQELLKLRNYLENNYKEEVPTVDYSDKILAQIKEEQLNKYSGWLVSIYPKVAVACGIFILFSLLHLTFSTDNLTVDTLVGLEDIAPEDAYTYINFQQLD